MNTCEVVQLLILFYALSFYFHHFSLNASVADVTEIMHVLLHTLCYRVSNHWCEAAFALLKVFVVLHLELSKQQYVYSSFTFLSNLYFCLPFLIS